MAPQPPEPGAITDVLARWQEERLTIGQALYPLVYDELHRIATAHMRGERIGHTLQPTALVNEAFLELERQNRVRWNDRRHFFRLASQLMRRILKMYARSRGTAKRGGDVVTCDLTRDPPDLRAPGESALILGRLVEQLGEVDPLKAELVRMRALEELTVPECAERLGVAPATVDRHWRLARAWLREAVAAAEADDDAAAS